MSLANLGEQLRQWRELVAAAQTRANLAQAELKDCGELLAMYFLDSDPGARDFLRELAKIHRDDNKTVRVELIRGTRVTAEKTSSPGEST